MARLPRFVIPRQPQHVIQRGNNRQDIFAAESDYLFYLEKLEAAAKQHSCEIHAYVLMTNHVHLLLTPEHEDSIGKMMQMLGRYYVQYFNHSYQRSGTLWEGRYKATLIDSATYLLTCMRYIELNPVRAGMVKHPRQYPWTSYGYNALGKADKHITPHRQYKKLGPAGKERQGAYRQLFRSHLAEKTLDEIRTATNKSWVLGNDSFRKRIEKKLGRRVTATARGGDRKSKEYRKNANIKRFRPH